LGGKEDGADPSNTAEGICRGLADGGRGPRWADVNTSGPAAGGRLVRAMVQLREDQDGMSGPCWADTWEGDGSSRAEGKDKQGVSGSSNM
jgi:hypothetical protein